MSFLLCQILSNSDGTFRECLESSVGYATDECKTAPYVEALCAWPHAVSTPVVLTTRLPGADGFLSLERASKMPRPAVEAIGLKESCSVKASFSDPAPPTYLWIFSLTYD